MACPIVVEGGLWGSLAVTSREARPVRRRPRNGSPSFAELVATAIANARARAKVTTARGGAGLAAAAGDAGRPRGLARRCLRLGREEVGAVLGVSDSRLLRYEPDGTATVLASWGALRDRLPVGTNAPVNGRNVTALVRRTWRAARIDDYEHTDGALAEMVQGSVSAFGRRLPGRRQRAAVGRGRRKASVETEQLPADTEARLTQFTELVATAIANIDARARRWRPRGCGSSPPPTRRASGWSATSTTAPSSAWSRSRCGCARRRRWRRPSSRSCASALDQLSHGLTEVHESLRELSHGIHPSVLSEAGLRAALRALARRSAIPVTVDYEAGERYDEGLEVTAYYVVSEALANVVKHSGAERASVEVTSGEGELCVVVADDGTGGADPVRGSGMIGLIDRVEARGGTLNISSPVNGGTTLRVAFRSSTECRPPRRTKNVCLPSSGRLLQRGRLTPCCGDAASECATIDRAARRPSARATAGCSCCAATRGRQVGAAGLRRAAAARAAVSRAPRASSPRWSSRSPVCISSARRCWIGSERLPEPQRDALGDGVRPARRRRAGPLPRRPRGAEPALRGRRGAAAGVRRRRRAVARSRLGAGPRLRRTPAARRAGRARLRHARTPTTASSRACRSSASRACATTTRARCCARSSAGRSTSAFATGSSPRRAATRSRCWSCPAG